jgi:predicted phosphodiesterase
MPVKILATADLHLGRTASAVPGNAEERSTKYTWHRMVDWCVRNKVDVLLLAGDVVDEDNRFFEAVGPLQSGFDSLKKAGIEVYLIAGNHDHNVLAQIAGNHQYENVHMLGSGGNWEIQTHSVNNMEIQFMGWSFPQKYVSEEPVRSLNHLDADPNQVTIGLLHGEVDVPDSKYAPLGLDRLRELPVDAWILGHIHKPVEFQEKEPYIAYTGTPHALNSGEPGLHGPLLLEVEGKQDMRIKRIPLSPVRYEALNMDVSKAEDEESFRNMVSSGLLDHARGYIQELENVAYLVYDIELTGQSAHASQVDAWSHQIMDYTTELETGTRVSVRKALNHVQPAVQNLEELAQNESPAGKLADTILAIQKGDSTPFLDELIKEWYMHVNRIDSASAYHPLRMENRLRQKTEKEAREYILEECNRLLGVLLAQQQK